MKLDDERNVDTDESFEIVEVTASDDSVSLPVDDAESKRKAKAKALEELRKLGEQVQQEKSAAAKAVLNKRAQVLERKVQLLSGTVPDFKDLDAQGKPRQTRANIRALIEFYNIEVLYDGLADVKMMRGDVFQSEGLYVQESRYRQTLKTHAAEWGIAVNNLFDGMLDELVNSYKTHPRRDWMLSKPWDGVDRFEELWATLRVREAYAEFIPLYREYLYRWCLYVAKTGLVPCGAPYGVKADGMLLLQGPQHRGKTQWVEFLMPKESRWVATGRKIEGNDRDSVLKIIKYWVVEVGEMEDSLTNKTIHELKRWITSDVDEVREMYHHKAEIRARRTVPVGTVNSERFLVDVTGNRRFWVIPVSSCAAEPGHITGVKPLQQIDLQQLWAQFAHLARDPNADNAHDLNHERAAWCEKVNRLHTLHKVLDSMAVDDDAVKAVNADSTSAAADLLHEVEREILRLFELDATIPLAQRVTARDVKRALTECSVALQTHYPNASDRGLSRHVATHLKRLNVTNVNDAHLGVEKYGLRRR